VGQDSSTQFYPWYGYLGDQIGRGRIPEWNPAQFAGAPFAADPQAGWGYLPAMVLFTLLPLVGAVVAFIGLHALLTGLGAYTLARLVGCVPLGAAVAGVGYLGTGVFLSRSPCCPASYEIVTWVPIVLIGAEVLVRAESIAGRVGGVSVAGLAISQALAAWIGQGAYYLLIMVGAFFAYRVIVDPPTQRAWARGRRQRLTLLVLGGGAMLAVGFGLAAMSVLPRLEFNAVSNVAGGVYTGSGAVEAVVGGSSKTGAIDRFLQPSLYYPGVATLTLSVLAVLLVRGRRAGRFWIALAVGAMILTVPSTTPLHALLYLLPRMESLHRHYPERVMLVAFVGMAMLAGSAVSAVHGVSSRRRLGVVAVPLLLLGVLGLLGTVIPTVALLTTVAACGLWLVTQTWRGPVATAAACGLIVLIALDSGSALHRLRERGAPFGGFHRVDLAASYAPPPAAVALSALGETGAPFRFAGYDPSLVFIEDGQTVLYRYQFADPRTRDLVVNNRAMLLGLEDSQGYNPIQVGLYPAYVAAMNGAPQEYHGADVYPGGLESPLLDLLNVRYLITPTIGAGNADDRFARAGWRTVVDLGNVRIVENPGTMPRAWIVHEARPVAVGDQAAAVAGGTIDPAQVALVDGEVPAMAPVTDPTADRATVIPGDDPDRLAVRTETTAAGLLVLSEVAYPAWEATVDGKRVEVLTANGLFRAVPIPAGEHTVVLRYRSAATARGLAISAATAAATLAALGWASWPERRRGGRWRKASDSSSRPIDTSGAA